MRSGALPPLCEPASANGLRKVKMRDDRPRRGELRFSIVARPTIVQFAPAGPAVAVAWVGSVTSGPGRRSTSVRLSTSARWITFRSSRTLPGHE